MIVTIRYITGIDDPTEERYENVAKIDTIEEWGYKRLVFNINGNKGITNIFVPLYLIAKLTVE